MSGGLSFGSPGSQASSSRVSSAVGNDPAMRRHALVLRLLLHTTGIGRRREREDVASKALWECAHVSSFKTTDHPVPGDGRICLSGHAHAPPGRSSGV